jgi:hypothetical protein
MKHLQGLGKPCISEAAASNLDAKRLFALMGWGDTWPEAALTDVVVYLRGNSGLNIPDAWRPFLPDSIPEY